MKKSLTPGDQEQENQSSPSGEGFLVVGIGASAGGIEALQAFFEQVPPDSGVAYVVILHLSPDHDSQLAALLQATTAIPVTQVQGAVHIQPDHIYVVPPNRHLLLEDGYIRAQAHTSVEERRAPVDIFFRSLADTRRSQAICVILSGTGANGSMGLKRVKELGGAVFVQNPREAVFNEMPRNAISTGQVDEVLNVADIPAQILAYRNSLSRTHISEDPALRDEDEQQALREIFTQLRLRTGHDFSNYKRATLMRRIERRMAIRSQNSLPGYASFSNEHPEETQSLLKDLLISVTNFFRDKTPFEYLEAEILPELFNNRNSEDQVRLWVAGCATGEEAYSLAILCAERAMGVVDAPKVQIFATDIDEGAIATAREGYYTLNDAADVSPERLARFFTKEGEGYRIRREIRETVLFAHHNFLKDPPFSRIDLISCRNVLIYLNRPAQERVMETFHFALKPGGVLMLGTSESVDSASDLFKMTSREQHIYQSRLARNQRPIVVPDAIQPLRLVSPVIPQHAPVIPATQVSYGDLHLQLLEEYAPPSLIVNAEFDLVHSSPRAGRYMQLAGGEPTQAILKLIREELRSELRNGLYQAAQKGTPVSSLPLSVRTAEGSESIRIHVRPVESGNMDKSSFLLVVFEPAGNGEQQLPHPVLHTSDESAARHLEEELSRLRLMLRASNEQHEFQAEELKAGNEELQAMNEELRSATEELETSKEELQSINEELSTVNQELKVKVEEATMVSNNLQNLINSTDIGTIFLDRSLRVVLFTPAVRSIFNLIPADYGRPLSDITSRLEQNTLLDDAQIVLDRLQMIERETRTTDGRSFLARLAPYRTEEDRIQGVVISLVDITERRKAAEALRISDERYRMLFNSIDEGFCIIEMLFESNGRPVDYRFLEVNPAFEKQTSLAGAIGKTAREMAPLHEQYWFDIFGRIARSGVPERFENEAKALGLFYDVYAFRVGEPGENLVAVLFSDITERKRQEWQQEYLLRLADALRPISDPLKIQAVAARMLGEYLETNQAHYGEISGDEIVVHQGYGNGLPPVSGRFRAADFGEGPAAASRSGQIRVIRDIENDPLSPESERKALRAGGIGAYIAVPLVKKGDWVATLSVRTISPRNWNAQEIELVRETAERTWTAVEQARIEEALRKSEEKYRTLFDSMDEGFCIIEMIYDDSGNAVNYRFVEVNRAYERHTGQVDPSGKTGDEIAPGAELYWLEIYKKVTEAGDPVRFENYHQDTGRWYEAYASRVRGADSHQIAIVFNDITGRKRREATMNLLNEVSEDLVQSTDMSRTMDELCKKLAGHFGASYCAFSEVDEEAGLVTTTNVWHRPEAVSVAGTHRITDYHPEETRRLMRSGKPEVVRDISVFAEDIAANMTALKIGAYVNTPLVRNGQWRVTLSIVDSRPRDWRDDEIELMRELVSRIWTRLERARAEDALRTNEERMRGQKEAFQAAVNGASLVDSLNVLARMVTNETEGEARTAFYLANEAGTKLHPVIGAGDMPEAYLREIDGFAIGFDSLACGLAIPTGEPEITPDVADAPLWQPWLHLAAKYDYKGCWSFPIKTRENKGVGTFAMYFGTPHEATPGELALAEIVTQSAAMIISSYNEIRERLQTQEALRGSEERISKLLELMPAAVYTCDAAGRITYFNRRAAEIWGREPRLGNDQDIFCGSFRMWTPDGELLRHERCPMADAVRHGRAARNLEVVIEQPAGDRLVANVNIDPLFDAEGHITGAINVFVDVTELKKAELALRIAEESNRVALQSANMAAWDWNIPEDSIRWNDQHFLLLGLEPRDHPVNTRFFQQFVHPEDAAAVDEELRQAVEETGTYRMEAFRVIRADGEVRWMTGFGRALSREQGRATRMVGVMYDITERVAATQALHDEQLKLEIAQRAARVGIWGFDLVKQQGIASPEWNELTGYPHPGDTFEMSIFLELVHPDDQAALMEAHNRAVREQSSVEIEFRIQHPERGTLWLLKRGQYIPSHSGMNAALMGSLIDITERKLLEEQKDEFVGIASHELRTPVTSIKAYTEVLAEMLDEKGDAHQSKLMQKLNLQVDRLASLIYALLDTTRIAEGKLRLELSEVLADELIADTVESMQRISDRPIVTDLRAQVRLAIDRERIRQVLTNLISNAIKYAPGTERIDVQSSADAHAVTVCVRDYGAGIPQALRKRVFERFFGNAESGSHSGLGLGLFISASIIQKHGGTIWVQEHEGKGAMFCFRLPLQGG